MNNLSQRQIEKLKLLAKISEEGSLAIADEFNSLKDRMDTISRVLNDGLNTAVKMAEVTQKMQGPKGDKAIAGLDFPIPKDGKDYVLTQNDLKKVAKMVKVPIVEKVIEIVKEQPLVTEMKTEVKVENPVTGFDIIQKINNLDILPELQIDIAHIRDLEDLLRKIELKYGKNVVASNRNLYQLLDVSIAGIATNQSIKWNGTQWVAYTPTAGGYTKATPTGSVNGSNITYTVTNEPVYVVADGTTYFDGAGYTYSALSIVMANAPAAFIRYFY